MATITLTGTPLEGLPTPSVSLFIFVDGQQVVRRDILASQVVLGQPYTLSAIYDVVGSHSTYGTMLLRNDVGEQLLTSNIVAFTIQALVEPTWGIGSGASGTGPNFVQTSPDVLNLEFGIVRFYPSYPQAGTDAIYIVSNPLVFQQRTIDARLDAGIEFFNINIALNPSGTAGRGLAGATGFTLSFVRAKTGQIISSRELSIQNFG